MTAAHHPHDDGDGDGDREKGMTIPSSSTEDTLVASSPSPSGDELPTPPLSNPQTGPRNSNVMQEEAALTLVSFEEGDKANPHNWSTTRKAIIVLTGVILCVNSTMGSTLTANMFPYLEKQFNLPPAGPQSVLAASVYLIGFMSGPLISAPLSESHGRRPVLVIGFVLFVFAVLGSGLSPTWECFLVMRFLTGTFGSPPNSVVGGVIADLFADELVRGRVMMIWSAATVVGPVSGPIISGFVSPVGGWRWTFWRVFFSAPFVNRIALLIAVVSAGFVFALPETLASKILQRKAARLNRLEGYRVFIAPADLNRRSFWVSMKTTLSRPLRLLCREMLLSLTCIYMAFVYAIFYMLVKIFPYIFEGVYGFNPGMAGVLFSLMAIGTFIGCFAALSYDKIAPTITAKHPAKRPEYLRLPIACAGGPPFVISLLWLGWASSPKVPWAVPWLALLPYGFAYQLIFVAMINYVADAYEIYAASALAACSMTRSIAGALIPLATDKMLSSLGIAWSCTVLAIISAGLGCVPFLFITYGERIRAASHFSRSLKKKASPSSSSSSGCAVEAVGEEGLTRSLSAV
ncbi:major facilitator superfamily domain-containing protein [Echria macrotheca]|uniref:Major facilitator superfamily domain-containing protein n=1 Tax=Echria macrotheca TaxID=438768 RepID=A0AAJ0FB33_9PEZI|nr:major facilitator superfamily domain-containing protein [Echria macrotheca]